MEKNEKEELEFLRWFYSAIGDYLGPADDDIYDSLLREYKGVLPDSYKPEED